MSTGGDKVATKEEDFTGRNRIVWNVITGWGSYLVFVVAGFVMPRLIDSYEGQTALGIWDFSWALVNYLAVAELGVGSAVNRYVAKYRTKGQFDRLNQTVSSVVAIQCVIALFVLLCALTVVVFLPSMLSGTVSDDELLVARWVVALLGASAAFQMAMQSGRGVITGCHRWDINNYINSGSYFVSVVIMMLCLMLGYGLLGMAVVYLSVGVVAEIMRMRIAHRVCPQLRISRASIRWAESKKMMRFGIKVFLTTMPALITVQVVSILVAIKLGPAALAIFARPIALVRHVSAFMSKFAMIFAPTASSLLEQNQLVELKALFLSTAKYSISLALPMLLVLAIYGDFLLELWMGPDYANWALIIILAAGFFLPVAHGFSQHMLIGMNQHGRAGLVSLSVSMATLFIGVLVLNDIGWTLVGAAVLVSISYSVGQGVVIPIYAARCFDVGFVEYVTKVLALPLACNLMFASILWFWRETLEGSIVLPMLGGLLSGGLVLMVLYWFFLLSPEHRQRVSHYLSSKFPIVCRLTR